MYLPLKRLFFLIPLLSLLFLSSCASLPEHPPVSALKTYKIPDGKSLLSRHSPLFTIENPEDRFNLIGTPTARITENGEEEIFVDYSIPTIYTEMRNFQTIRGPYTNLIYRIHFEKVPFGLMPFHVGQGKNVGLIAIVTLNSKVAIINAAKNLVTFNSSKLIFIIKKGYSLLI